MFSTESKKLFIHSSDDKKFRKKSVKIKRPLEGANTMEGRDVKFAKTSNKVELHNRASLIGIIIALDAESMFV